MTEYWICAVSELGELLPCHVEATESNALVTLQHVLSRECKQTSATLTIRKRTNIHTPGFAVTMPRQSTHTSAQQSLPLHDDTTDLSDTEGSAVVSN